MGFFTPVFTPFDKKVDPKLGEALKKLDNAENVINSAVKFESSFIGTSASDAHARAKKIVSMLNGENNLFKEEFNKTDFKSINHDDVENFSMACTLIQQDSNGILGDFGDLNNVSNAIIAIVNILLNSGSFDIKSVDELKKLKNSELAILSLSKDVYSVFNKLYRAVDNVKRDIDDGIYTQKDWDNIRIAALPVIKDIDAAEKIVSEIVVALRNSFVMLRDVIKIDISLKSAIQEHLNVIVHGNEMELVKHEARSGDNAAPDPYSTRGNMDQVKREAHNLYGYTDSRTGVRRKPDAIVSRKDL